MIFVYEPLYSQLLMGAIGPKVSAPKQKLSDVHMLGMNGGIPVGGGKSCTKPCCCRKSTVVTRGFPTNKLVRGNCIWKSTTDVGPKLRFSPSTACCVRLEVNPGSTGIDTGLRIFALS